MSEIICIFGVFLKNFEKILVTLHERGDFFKEKSPKPKQNKTKNWDFDTNFLKQ